MNSPQSQEALQRLPDDDLAASLVARPHPENDRLDNAIAEAVDLIAEHLFPKEKRADVMLRAVEVLSRVKEPAAVKKVVGFASHGTTDRRVVFAEAIAKIDTTESHEALLELIEDKEPRIRGMAAYGLGMHRHMDALEPLLKTLDDRFWQVPAERRYYYPSQDRA